MKRGLSLTGALFFRQGMIGGSSLYVREAERRPEPVHSSLPAWPDARCSDMPECGCWLMPAPVADWLPLLLADDPISLESDAAAATACRPRRESHLAREPCAS